MSKSTTTYRRKSDGVMVEVILEPAGWRGYKKIYEADGNAFRVSDEVFEEEYELPTSIFRRFVKGIIK